MELISTESTYQRHLTSRFYRRIALSPGAPPVPVGCACKVETAPNSKQTLFCHQHSSLRNLQLPTRNNDSLISESFQSSEYPHFALVLLMNFVFEQMFPFTRQQ
jgi:hypothetical protein